MLDFIKDDYKNVRSSWNELLRRELPQPVTIALYTISMPLTILLSPLAVYYKIKTLKILRNLEKGRA